MLRTILRLRIPDKQKLILLYIWDSGPFDTSPLHSGDAYLLGMSERTLEKHVRELLDEGYLLRGTPQYLLVLNYRKLR